MRKLITCMLLLFVLIGTAQSKRISVSFDNLALDEIFALVTDKSGYYFSYNSEIISSRNRFTLKVENVSIDDFLNKLLLGTGLTYQVMGDQIIIKQNIVEVAPGQVSKAIFNISGQVIDSVTNSPVVGANVFLSGTNLGGVTDMNGYYFVDKVPVGSYEVIFTHLAYDMEVSEVMMARQGMVTLNARMSQNTRVLDTITVVSKRLVRPEERQRFIRIFEREFIGQSQNASQCKIKNPDILDFIFDPKDDKLEVFALEPVIIVNEYLGYEITYHFEVFQRIGPYVNFYGKARFENLIADSPKQIKQWKRNRQKTYEGSFLQFRRALVSDELKKNNFYIELYPTNEVSKVQEVKGKEVKCSDVLRKTETGDYLLEYDGLLMVTFRRRPDQTYDSDVFDMDFGPNFQKSVLELKDGALELKANGRMSYPGVATYGYWYWKRIADMLPENFDPENQEILNR